MVSLEFDPKVNALYLRFKKGEVSSSEPIAENLIIDFGKEGEMVSIELLLPPKLEEKIKAQNNEDSRKRGYLTLARLKP